MKNEIFNYINRLLILFVFILIFPIYILAQERGATRVSSTENKNGKTRALIIGVSEYPNLDKGMQLEYAHKDALLFQDFLLSFPNLVEEDDVSLLLNEEASNVFKIIPQFRRILDDSESGDLVILFFAGHGDIQNLSGKERGYLLLNKVEAPHITDYDATPETLPISTIKDYISNATMDKGVKVMLVFDACHSGKVVSTEENSSIVLSALSQEMKNSFNIVSAQQDELSYEDTKWGGGHGVFTWFLVNGAKGLADQNVDGNVTLMELRNYVQSNVLTETGDKQLPVINGNDREKIFFVQDELMAEAKEEMTKGLSKINSNIDPNDIAMNSNSRGKTRGLTVSPSADLLKSVNTVMITRDLTSLLVEGKIFPVEKESTSPDYMEEELITAKNNVMIDRAHRNNTSAITSSPLGSYIATSGERGIKIWNHEDDKMIKELDHKWVKSLAFSSDEKFLASGGSRDIKLWDVGSGKLIHTFKGHKARVNSILFDPTGKSLISVSEDGSLKIWSITKKNLRTTLNKPNSRSLNSAVYGAVPNHIYTGDTRGNIIEWDIESGEQIKRINTGGNVSSLAFAEGNNQLIIGFRNGTVSIYDGANLSIVKEIDLDINNLRTVVTNSNANFVAGGGKLWQFPIYDNGIGQKIYSQINVPRGITGGHFNNYHDEIFLSLNGGGWMSVKLSIPERDGGKSVYQIYNDKIAVLESTHDRIRLTHLIQNNILARAYDILDPYINSEPSLPSLEQATMLKRELEWAININEDKDFLSHKLNDYLLLTQSLEAILSGDFEELNTALDNLLTLKKNNPDASYISCLIASIYQKMRKLQEAKEQANLAANNIPDWVEPKLSIAYTLFLERNYKESDEIVANVIKSAPALSKAYVQRAKIKAVTGHYSEAQKLFEKAIAMDVSNSYYLIEYGLFHLRNGNIDKAKLIADKIRLVDQFHFGGSFIEAEIHFFNYMNERSNTTNKSKAFLADAYKSYLEAYERAPKNPIVNYRLAYFYGEAIKNKEILKDNFLNVELEESINSESRRARAIAKIASDHYEAVLKGNPFMYSAKIGMVEMKLVRSSGKKAKKRTSKIIKSLSKKTPEECYSLALNEKLEGKTKKAIKYIEKAISMDEENVFYYIKLLDILGIDDPQKAVEFISKNYPNMKAEYFERKFVSTYAFFNYI